MKLSKNFSRIFFLFILLFTLIPISSHKQVSAASLTYYVKKYNCHYDSKGRIVYKVKSSSKANQNALKDLLNNNTPKTIILPKGKTIHTGRILIGDNTTIIATGATIKGTSLLAHGIDGSGHYDALKNVKIIGGTWEVKNTSSACSMIRMAHAKNITFENMVMKSNHSSHAIELIGCKDVTIRNCKLYVKGSKSKKTEETIQMDIATRKTSPGVYSEGHHRWKYVSGQTCQNITIESCYVEGNRPISAMYDAINRSSYNHGRYRSRYHSNITIKNNTIVSSYKEGIYLNNVKALKITGNKVTTKGNFSALNVVFWGTDSASSGNVKTTTAVISDNYLATLGKASALRFRHMGGSSYFKKTTVSSNQLYSKRGLISFSKITPASKRSVSNNKRLAKPLSNATSDKVKKAESSSEQDENKDDSSSDQDEVKDDSSSNQDEVKDDSSPN